MKIYSKKNHYKKIQTLRFLNCYSSRIIIFIVAGLILYIGLTITLYRLGRYSAFEQSLRFFQHKFSSSRAPSPKPTPTPTPRPIRPLPSGKQEYRGSFAPSMKGPKVKEIIIDPLTPKIGEKQKITLTITNDSEITKAEIILHTDTKKTIYPLHLLSGTKKEGVWESQWNMPESYNYSYFIQCNIQSETGSYTDGLMFRT